MKSIEPSSPASMPNPASSPRRSARLFLAESGFPASVQAMAWGKSRSRPWRRPERSRRTADRRRRGSDTGQAVAHPGVEWMRLGPFPARRGEAVDPLPGQVAFGRPHVFPPAPVAGRVHPDRLRACLPDPGRNSVGSGGTEFLEVAAIVQDDRVKTLSRPAHVDACGDVNGVGHAQGFITSS